MCDANAGDANAGAGCDDNAGDANAGAVCDANAGDANAGAVCDANAGDANAGAVCDANAVDVSDVNAGDANTVVVGDANAGPVCDANTGEANAHRTPKQWLCVMLTQRLCVTLIMQMIAGNTCGVGRTLPPQTLPPGEHSAPFGPPPLLQRVHKLGELVAPGGDVVQAGVGVVLRNGACVSGRSRAFPRRSRRGGACGGGGAFRRRGRRSVVGPVQPDSAALWEGLLRAGRLARGGLRAGPGDLLIICGRESGSLRGGGTGAGFVVGGGAWDRLPWSPVL